MTPDQIVLVQDSFRRVGPIEDKISNLFYHRLFEVAPQVAPLFRDDMGVQKKKFMQMLELLVKGLNTPESFLPEVVGLGQRHTSYDVAPEHYVVVGESLIWALDYALGEDFTEDMHMAWVAAYGTLADVMIGAGSELT